MKSYRLLVLLALVGLLGACSGGSLTPGTSSNSQPAAIANPGNLSSADALKVAQAESQFLSRDQVLPTSFDFTTKASQTLTVTVGYPTLVFVASSNPKVVTITPDYQEIRGSNGGSATFTVQPNATGKASIGLLDTHLNGEIVPVTVAIGASTPIPSSTPSTAPSPTPSPSSSSTPTGTPAPTPSASPTPITGASKIYVVNAASGSVTTYTANGTQTTPTITGLGSHPDALAVDASGKIYVGGTGGTLTTYNADGSPSTPTITTGLSALIGVAVDTAGKIYVADNGNTITTYAANGTVTVPTINVTYNGYPLNVNGLTVDSTGKIYAAASGDGYGVLLTYDVNGNPTTPIVNFGQNAPTSVAVDASGKIYVLDAATQTLTTYTSGGTPTTPTITDLNAPISVAVDAAGKIYLTNSNNTVTTYNPDGSPSTPTITAGLNEPVGIVVH